MGKKKRKDFISCSLVNFRKEKKKKKKEKKLVNLSDYYKPELWDQQSPSGNEGAMTNYLIRYLRERGHFFSLYNNGIIEVSNAKARQKKKGILLSAHQDTVFQLDPKYKIMMTEDGKEIVNLSNSSGVGGDDKCGIWIILRILEEVEDVPLRVLFTVGEETGGQLTKVHVPFINKSYMCLVFDRKGKDDLILSYCRNDELEKVIQKVGEKYEYSDSMGLWSDADFISKYIPSVNISSGYYSPHTALEWVNLEDMERALKLGIDLVRTVELKKYKQEEKCCHYYGGTYENYWKGKRCDLGNCYQGRSEDFYFCSLNEIFNSEEVSFLVEVGGYREDVRYGSMAITKMEELLERYNKEKGGEKQQEKINEKRLNEKEIRVYVKDYFNNVEIKKLKYHGYNKLFYNYEELATMREILEDVREIKMLESRNGFLIH